jgi:hypothetical protein
MMFRSLVFAIASLAATSCLGQSSVFEALKGKSIVIDYRESFSGPRGSFGVVWRDRIYVSTEGRIFHKVDARSNNPRASGESNWSGKAAVANAGRRLGTELPSFAISVIPEPATWAAKQSG